MLIDSAQIVADTAAMLALADAQTPPPVVVSELNWSANIQSSKKIFDGYLLNPNRIKSQFYDYKNNGALGIPSLAINVPVEYMTLPGSATREPQGAGIDIDAKDGKRHIVPNSIGLATSSCLFFDLELSQKLGAWGPECKITQFLQTPTQGDLVKKTVPGADAGDYYYTPRKPNTQDVVRFILENGAGKKVEVTVNLNVGGDDTDYSVMFDSTNQPNTSTGTTWENTALATVLANAGLSLNGFDDLVGAAIGQTNASGIILDTNASGYGWFIDTTPSDNSEYLPTSNPNEWVARAGTAAGRASFTHRRTGVRSSIVAFPLLY